MIHNSGFKVGLLNLVFWVVYWCKLHESLTRKLTKLCGLIKEVDGYSPETNILIANLNFFLILVWSSVKSYVA